MRFIVKTFLITMSVITCSYAHAQIPGGPILQYAEPIYVHTISPPSQNAGPQFAQSFDTKTYGHYSGEVSADYQEQQTANVDCEQLKAQVEEFLLKTTNSSNTFEVIARFGEVKQTRESYGLWSAPFCAIDVALFGTAHFSYLETTFKGSNAKAACEAAYNADTSQAGFISGSCIDQSFLFFKKFVLQIQSIAL